MPPADSDPPTRGASAPGAPGLAAEADSAAPALDLLRRAIGDGATDVHIDPSPDDEYEIRFRVDGRLREFCRMDRSLAESLVKRLKVLSDLDIAEPFEAQEGLLDLSDKEFEGAQVRITCAPVDGGECACLRIHQSAMVTMPIDDLGISSGAQSAVREMTSRPEGLILVAGPTGAGKTTTIYSMLRELTVREGDMLIASIEDPVEMSVPFIRQMSVDVDHGITLASGLRTMLRMDPDVLFVGEIRDVETADMVMRAASSGRRVFATLHSRSVPASVTAFDDLGVDRRSLSANLTGIVSQRLARKLCERCKKTRPLEDHDRTLFEDHGLGVPDETWHAEGCDACQGSGYEGREGVFQVALVDDGLRAAIARGANESELGEVVQQSGSESLGTVALKKVIGGVTSLEEVHRQRVLGASGARVRDASTRDATAAS